MPEPMRIVAERAATEKERIEESLISVREVLPYLEQDRFFNLAEASKYLSMSSRTIRERLDEIPHYRVGSKMLLFKKSELDEWMLQYREGGKDELEELVDETLAKVI